MNDNDLKGLLVLVSLILLTICVRFCALLFGLHGVLVGVAVIVVGFFGLATLGDAVRKDGRNAYEESDRAAGETPGPSAAC
jgi:hypothetical protein